VDAALERLRLHSHAGAWERLRYNAGACSPRRSSVDIVPTSGVDIVPTLQRGNAALDAPASSLPGVYINQPRQPHIITRARIAPMLRQVHITALYRISVNVV